MGKKIEVSFYIEESEGIKLIDILGEGGFNSQVDIVIDQFNKQAESTYITNIKTKDYLKEQIDREDLASTIPEPPPPPPKRIIKEGAMPPRKPCVHEWAIQSNTDFITSKRCVMCGCTETLYGN